VGFLEKVSYEGKEPLVFLCVAVKRKIGAASRSLGISEGCIEGKGGKNFTVQKHRPYLQGTFKPHSLLRKVFFLELARKEEKIFTEIMAQRGKDRSSFNAIGGYSMTETRFLRRTYDSRLYPKKRGGRSTTLLGGGNAKKKKETRGSCSGRHQDIFENLVGAIGGERGRTCFDPLSFKIPKEGKAKGNRGERG